MALGSTQPVVKMSTRNIPGGKGGRCVRLITYHHIVPMSRILGAFNFLDPSGPAWPVTGVLYLLDVYIHCCLYTYNWPVCKRTQSTCVCIHVTQKYGLVYKV